MFYRALTPSIKTSVNINWGLLPYKLDRIWHKLTYSGLGTAPIVVQSRQALIDAVLANPGAIGYVKDGTNIKDKYVIPIKN